MFLYFTEISSKQALLYSTENAIFRHPVQLKSIIVNAYIIELTSDMGGEYTDNSLLTKISQNLSLLFI